MFIFEAYNGNGKLAGCGSDYTIMLDEKIKAYRRTNIYKIIKEEMGREKQDFITKRIHHWKVRAVPHSMIFRENAGYVIETIKNPYYKEGK